jgi:hypothetical protein
MSPIFTRACRSGPRSWCSINSAAEVLVSAMEFSERPLRGGLSVFIRADMWLMSAIGTKRTSPSALHMSAVGIKRTSEVTCRSRQTLRVQPPKLSPIVGSWPRLRHDSETPTLPAKLFRQQLHQNQSQNILTNTKPTRVSVGSARTVRKSRKGARSETCQDSQDDFDVWTHRCLLISPTPSASMTIADIGSRQRPGRSWRSRSRHHRAQARDMHSTVSGLVGGDERRTRIVFGWRDTGLG